VEVSTGSAVASCECPDVEQPVASAPGVLAFAGASGSLRTYAVRQISLFGAHDD
jgi:hypothetical protein